MIRRGFLQKLLLAPLVVAGCRSFPKPDPAKRPVELKILYGESELTTPETHVSFRGELRGVINTQVVMGADKLLLTQDVSKTGMTIVTDTYGKVSWFVIGY